MCERNSIIDARGIYVYVRLTLGLGILSWLPTYSHVDSDKIDQMATFLMFNSYTCKCNDSAIFGSLLYSRFHLAGIRTSEFFNPGICRVLTMHASVLIVAYRSSICRFMKVAVLSYVLCE